MVAGEASGDALGAALIRSLRVRAPALAVEGVAGPGMCAAGCAPLADIGELSVMGLAEVIRHVPRLAALRRRLVRHLLRSRPHVFVGIDAPDFNLGLEARLRAAGIRTVHYVSPTVWAWRRGRVRTIARAVDRVLTLFPFETSVYREAGVDARCVGHPLAATLVQVDDPAPARAALGLPAHRAVLALLPGSRPGEWSRHAGLFVAAAQALARRVGPLAAVVPLARPDARPVLEAAFAGAPGLDGRLLDGRAHEAMAAADVVLAASGTATLEAALIGRPMVVAYRLAPLTHALARRLVHTPFVALPNLLAGRALVPEFIQDAAQPEALAAALAELLEPARARQVRDGLRTLRAILGPSDPAGAAAQAVLEVAYAGAA
jgi:lipid-A-disaccharide synthase